MPEPYFHQKKQPRHQDLNHRAKDDGRHIDQTFGQRLKLFNFLIVFGWEKCSWNVGHGILYMHAKKYLYIYICMCMCVCAYLCLNLDF